MLVTLGHTFEYPTGDRLISRRKLFPHHNPCQAPSFQESLSLHCDPFPRRTEVKDASFRVHQAASHACLPAKVTIARSSLSRGNLAGTTSRPLTTESRSPEQINCPLS